MLNEALTEDQRSRRLALLLREWLDNAGKGNIAGAFDTWNGVMADIVEQYGLTRQ